MSKEEISIEDVVSGQVKMEYVDQLELLRENLSSNSFLNNKSNKKELLKLVENLIDLMPVELRTARFVFYRMNSCTESNISRGFPPFLEGPGAPQDLKAGGGPPEEE